MNKKQIPYELLTSIEPIIKDNIDVIRTKTEDNCYYSLYDKEEKSPFLFRVIIDPKKENVGETNDKSSILCEYKPFGLNDISLNKIYATKDKVGEHLKEWIISIRKYNEANSIYDDPFLKQYQTYFLDQFKILDIDADTAPFNPKQQEGIDKHLQYIEKKLLGYKCKEEEQPRVDEILEDVREAQENLQNLTKIQVFQKIAKIWAKTYKWSRKQAKDILKKANDEFIKELIKEGVKYAVTATIEAYSK